MVKELKDQKEMDMEKMHMMTVDYKLALQQLKMTAKYDSLFHEVVKDRVSIEMSEFEKY